MPNYLNRSTKEFLRSVPSYELPEPEANYIEDPDLSAVTGEPSKYWVITGDDVTLMDQNEQDVVDAAAEQARLDSIANELDQTQTILKAFAEVMLDQLNTLRAEHSLPAATLAQLKAAVRGKL